MQQKQTLHVKNYQSGLEDSLESTDYYTSKDNITKVLIIYQYKIAQLERDTYQSRAYLRGGSNPPPKFSDFFLKSEGKEIERKMKKDGGF